METGSGLSRRRVPGWRKIATSMRKRMSNMMPTDAIHLLLALNLMAYVERAFSELRPGVTFHYGLYLRAMCHHLERVARGEIKRLLILLPPRHLKSHCASVCF